MPSVRQPHLYVWPLRLDAGFIAVNSSTSLMLEVGNRGGGTLHGRTETNLRCLTTDPDTLDARTESLRVKIDATNLPPGPYVCHLALRTNGGDQIIPVRFVVQGADVPVSNRRRTMGPLSH